MTEMVVLREEEGVREMFRVWEVPLQFDLEGEQEGEGMMKGRRQEDKISRKEPGRRKQDQVRVLLEGSQSGLVPSR